MIYDFHCTSCPKTTTAQRKVAQRDEPLFCLDCGEPMKRSVGSGHFSLKGDGWFADGYSKALAKKRPLT